MTKAKSTHWVTIPEETVHMPDVSGAPALKHKGVWAVALVVLLAVGGVMVAPERFQRLLQGNLFETGGTPAQEQPIQPLSVIPVNTEPAAMTEPAPAAVTSAQIQESPSLVAPQTEAVSVQVTPAPASDAEAAQQLMQELQKEIGAQAETVAIRPVAPETPITPQVPAATEVTVAPVVATAAPAALQTAVTVGQTPAEPVYRQNPYRVTVLPQTVLEQNQNRLPAPAAAPQTYAAASQGYTPSANLGGAQGTPESGPVESLALAFLSAWISIMGYKTLRLRRVRA